MARKSDISLRKVTRIAGLSYILVILLGIFNVKFIEPAAMITGNIGLGSHIITNALLFRIGIACEVLMYLLVVILSLALYIIVKPVDKELALSALFFRFGEAMVGSTSVILSGIIPLLILNYEPAFDKSQINALVESFLNVRTAGLNIVMIFIGVGGTIYCHLFYRSWIIPRILAAWGIFTYVSMFILGFLNIILPDRPNMIEMVLFSLGGIFELLFGLWLLFKGVNFDRWKTLASEAS